MRTWRHSSKNARDHRGSAAPEPPGACAFCEATTACPGLDWITGDVRRRLLEEPGIETVRVDVVWERWSPCDMSPSAREAFRRWGTTP